MYIYLIPDTYQSGVGLSGTLSIPLSLHFVQITPPIPHAKNAQATSIAMLQNNHEKHGD